MNYLSVCSGIEAATVAWHDLGFNPIGFSEIEKFPSELLAHHYPNVTNFGDMTKFKEWNLNEPINLLVGGTPCQSFSVAGLRKGLADPRGNLMLTYLAMADYFKPKWLLWENVPGVLSSNGGRDFAALLQGLAELGYGFAYRVLDAQYFGVPQRRRRVFVVGCFGDWRSAAKVLFEPESLCRDITPRRSQGEEATGTLTRGFGDRGYDLDQIAGGGYKIDAYREADLHNYKETQIAGTSKASGGVLGGGSETFVAKTLTTSNQRLDAGTETFVYGLAGNTIGRKPENGGNGTGYSEDVSYTLTKMDVHAVAFKVRGGCEGGGKGYLGSEDTAFTLSTTQDQQLFNKMRVRRLTTMECERLQGFPDNYTNTPTSSDTTRYRALGNSMAVPVMAWIGKRIKMIENEV